VGNTLKRSPLLWVTLWLIAVALSSMALVSTAGTAKAAGVTPTVVPGNPTCKDLLAPKPAFEIKVDPPTSGTYGPITVTFSPDGKLVDFTSTVPVLGVFVKGGTAGGNFYDYRPGGSTGDTGLEVPTRQEISHVSFCWNEEPTPPDETLSVTKTAEATYDRKIAWDLKKTVDPASHSGTAGETFNSTWSVEATKSVVEDNYKVTGEITITNPNSQAVGFSVTDKLDDGTMADVDCDPNTDGNQASGTVPANGSAECSYTASPPTKDATTNNAQVSSTTGGVPGATALADVMWQANVIGNEEVTLADPRFDNFSEEVSDTTTKTFPETFTCPTDPTKYTNFLFTKTITNTATLTGPNTNLSKSAQVKFTCTYPWRGETATGAGTRYPGTSNWFMYTAFTTNKVDLIAGQHYDAGDIYMTRNGTSTYIKITLHTGFRWANVSQNLKIQDFANAPTKYVQPGNFKYKFTVTPQSTVTYTAKIPGTTAKFYGIHADVERFVN
jgi:hypothetical protein